jgi:transcriptional regulator with XRE-family HTH domain
VAKKLQQPSILITFGENLRFHRNQKGIAQEKLAELADLDRTYISLLERGKRNPTLTCIAKLAKVLEVGFDDLCAEVKGGRK